MEQTLVREIPLTRGLVALIDHEDFALVSRFRWYASLMHATNKGFYACACLGKRQAAELGFRHIKMHRLLLGFHNEYIDHINNNGLDNRRKNLRTATRTLNLANSRKTCCPKSSKYKGVSWHRGSRRWQAFICNGKNRYLGGFHTEEEAALAYDVAAVAMFGDFALLNFPNTGDRI